MKSPKPTLRVVPRPAKSPSAEDRASVRHHLDAVQVIMLMRPRLARVLFRLTRDMADRVRRSAAG